MKVSETELPGVLLLELDVYPDERGQFFEIFNDGRYQSLGLPTRFVQDNFSRSRKGVVRGLHYQQPRPQGKLVQVLRGRILDVAVDLRRSSAHFARWVGIELWSDRPTLPTARRRGSQSDLLASGQRRLRGFRHAPHQSGRPVWTPDQRERRLSRSVSRRLGLSTSQRSASR